VQGVVVMAGFMIIAINPAVMMFIVMTGYVASGPIFHFFQTKKMKNSARKSDEKETLRLISKTEGRHEK